ncbi:MAG: hypothetical protein AB8G05_28230 [Oligoflexales bacterium]
MRPLFKSDGEPTLDPNGRWVKRAGVQVYLHYCLSKKHSYVDPNMAEKCCSYKKEKSNGWS